MSFYAQGLVPPSPTVSTVSDSPAGMLLIGQDLHGLNRSFLDVLSRQDEKRLLELAGVQIDGGADGLDLNPGPSRTAAERLAWAVSRILKRFDTRLFVGSAILQRQDLLAEYGDRITVNGVTAEPEGLERAMKTVVSSGSGLVVFLTRPDGQDNCLDSLLLLAMEVLETAEQVGFPLNRLYLDPLFSWHWTARAGGLGRGVPDIDFFLEVVAGIHDLRRETVQTITALAASSQFLPVVRRKALHRLLLPLFLEAGLSAVIMNCKDSSLLSELEKADRIVGRQ